MKDVVLIKKIVNVISLYEFAHGLCKLEEVIKYDEKENENNEPLIVGCLIIFIACVITFFANVKNT